MKKQNLLVLLLTLTLSVSPAYAQKVIDCPMAQTPFSLDAPLSDVLANSKAYSIINKSLPSVIELGKIFQPGFTNIITARHMQSFGEKLSEQELSEIENQLLQIPVTEADIIQRCERYDNDSVELPENLSKPAILVFEKINGYKDTPSVEAASKVLKSIADSHDFQMVVSDKAGVMNAETLSQFNAVIWNNISGDALTISQRAAFKNYIEQGGSFVGIHGSGGDPIYFWDWYVDELIGAKFIGHPMDPQFQEARLVVSSSETGITSGLPKEWKMKEEWYSFKPNPAEKGAEILLSVDESTYTPIGYGGIDISVGKHPLAWVRCVGKGRSFYSALGHLPEVYTEPNSYRLLDQAIAWLVNTNSDCDLAEE